MGRAKRSEVAQAKALTKLDRKYGRLASEHEALRQEVESLRSQSRAEQEKARSLADQLSQAYYMADVKSELLFDERWAHKASSRQWGAARRA